MDYMGFYDKRNSNCLLYIDLDEVKKLLNMEVIAVISALQRLCLLTRLIQCYF